MTASTIVFAKKRDVSDILNVTFLFVRENFKPLGRALLFLAGPFLVLQAVGGALFQQGLEFPTFEEQMQDPLAVWALLLSPGYLLALFAGVIGYFLILAVSYSYVMFYIEEAQQPTVEEVWNRLLYDFRIHITTWLGIFFFFFLLVFINVIPCLGQIAFLAGLIYFGVVFSIFWPVRLREHASMSASFTRSRYLVRDYFGPTLGLSALLLVIMLVISMTFSIPAYVIGVASGLNALSGSTSSTPFLVALVVSLCGLIGSFAVALTPLAFTFHYYNLTERKEASGLSDRVDEWARREVE